MKRLILIVMLLMILTTGCAYSMQPEHQAYAISLSVDRHENGQLTLGIQVPRIGGSPAVDEESPTGTPASSYAVFSATTPSFTECLDLLRATVPYSVRLSQLRSIVFGESLAREASFAQLVKEIAMTNYLNTSAIAIVCRANALNFLNEQHPAIGVRLSSSVVAELEHYHKNGYVPYTRLFDLFSSNNSIYSDSVLTLAATENPAKTTPLPAKSMGEALPGALPRTGDNKNQYMGCAMMRNGQMVGELDGKLTQYLEILLHETGGLSYVSGGRGLSLSVKGRPHFSLNLRPDAIDITLTLDMTATPLTDLPDLTILQRQIEEDLRTLITICQAHGVEPFKLSEYAAKHFLTVPEFIAYDFRDKFLHADVKINLTLTPFGP